MGFYSTFTTNDCGINWPQWFRDKYSDVIWFSEDGSGTINSLREAKTYKRLGELHNDIHRAIDWPNMSDKFILVYLHECGGVTRCQIEKDTIKWTEPESWRATEGVEHHYCYGCSDA